MARPIPITYAAIIISIGALAGLYAMVKQLNPSRVVTETEAAANANARRPPPPTMAPMPPASSGPIALSDRDNVPAWKRLREHIDELKFELDSLASAKAPPVEDLEPLCKKIKEDVVPLAGETNPEVSRTVNAARRACDLDRRLRLIELGLRLIPGDKTQADKKARCAWMGVQTKALIDGSLGDDPDAKPVVAKVGTACAL